MIRPYFSSVLDAIPYAVFVKDHQHRWVYGNTAFKKLIGCDDIIGKDDSHIFDEEQVTVFWREDDAVLAGEESLNEEQIGDNQFALTKKVPFTFEDGSRGLLGIVMDFIHIDKSDGEKAASLPHFGGMQPQMTALQKRLEEALSDKATALKVAQTDAATGLRNRRGLEVDLENRVKDAEKEGKSFGFALVDLDYFKRINDRFGHSVGDSVLKTVGKRLASLPGIRSVGRIGGDEFAVITEDLDELGDSFADRFERFRQIVFRPTTSGDREIKLSGSAGICIYPKDATTPSELLSRADLALFAGKRGGRAASQMFDENTLGAYRRRLQIEEKLPQALEQALITPVFQPIVSSGTRQPIGVEVLSRWHDKDLGHVRPDEFVAAATDMGLVGNLDRLVFRKAAQIAKPWIVSGEIEFVSFNASPMDVVTPGYATDFLREIAASGLPPSAICLEILESSLVEDVSSARRNLNRLREEGIQIALDDYGTGYSNLRALLDMPLDKLKIDKSLVSGIEEEDKVLDLVISLVQLGRALDLTMVAEGVETASQGAFIEGAGCPEMQGYYFAAPLSGLDMTAWLKDAAGETSADSVSQLAS